ncbi:MAG: radical SAM protein [Myxococcota bacterium]
MSRRPLVLVPQHFGSLVFDRRRSRYLPFDHAVTVRLREAIDLPLFSLPDGPALFEALEPSGFFDLNGRFDAEVVEAHPPAAHLLGPLAVHLEVIAACDLACAHCFAGELPRKGALSLDAMEALFVELAAMGSFRLGLTGGEPLLRRDLLEIVDAATAQGLHPCLTTHGLHLDEHWAKELGRRDLMWLNVSLDGASAATHDRIRGPGTFDRAIEKIRLLSRHARFTLAFTITTPLASEVEACAKLAKALGAHTAVFRPLYPVGTAMAHLDLMPSYDAYADALDRLAMWHPESSDLHAIDPFSPQIRETLQARTFVGKGCGAGTLIASVSSSGEVSPCSFLGPGAVAGRLDAASFTQIWNESEGFTALRQLGCDGCGGFEGGCRARAQTFNGHLDAPDPWYEEWRARQDRHPSTNVVVDR